MAKSPTQPTVNIKCPLAPEHCAVLSQVLQDCHDLRCTLDKLSSIGLDVSVQIAETDSYADMAGKIKAAFFPEAP